MSVVKRFNTRENVAALQQNEKNWEWKIPVRTAKQSPDRCISPKPFAFCTPWRSVLQKFCTPWRPVLQKFYTSWRPVLQKFCTHWRPVLQKFCTVWRPQQQKFCRQWHPELKKFYVLQGSMLQKFWVVAFPFSKKTNCRGPTHTNSFDQFSFYAFSIFQWSYLK